MDIWQLLIACLYGVVEGITEWLPISSTGHMLLLDEVVSLDVSEEFWNMFLVVIQLGAILAVCVLYFRQLNPFSLTKDAGERRATWGLWGKIVLACVPAALVGIPLDDVMERYLYRAPVVAAALVAYGVAFIAIERWRARSLERRVAEEAPRGAHFARPAAPAPTPGGDFGAICRVEDMPLRVAVGIGLFQVLSLIPGTSRSGSTIIGGLLLGCTRGVAAEFTFFLAIPVMFGASALKLAKYLLLDGGAFGATEAWVMVAGCLTAFLVSLAAIRWLTGFVRRHTFVAFGVYRIVLGLAVIAWFALAA